MKYLEDKFSVHPGASKDYRDNFDKVFGKKRKVEDDMPIIPPPIDMKPEVIEKPVKKKPKKKSSK
jgi:hypothetical protein